MVWGTAINSEEVKQVLKNDLFVDAEFDILCEWLDKDLRCSKYF